MTTDNHRNDELDQQLDEALAKYSAATPREGLEDRVLAHLRSRQQIAQPIWWRWPVSTAAALLIVVLLALSWKWHSSLPKNASRSLYIAPAQSTSEKPAPDNGHSRRDELPNKIFAKRRTVQRPRRAPEIANTYPKLDQFPSPQPLSEQEKILAGYIKEYPGHAALVAQARMEGLRHEAEERAAIANDDDSHQQSK